MGFDLRRGDEVFSVSTQTWARAYALAIEGGWEPKGTLPPKNLSKRDRVAWQGWYDSNDGQFITDDDASKMASALEKMLAVLPPPIAANPAVHDASALAGGRVEPRTYFAVTSKRKILGLLIKFLRGGLCEIR